MALAFPVHLVVVILTSTGKHTHLVSWPAHSQDCALAWIELPEQPRHQRVVLRVVLPPGHLVLNLLVRFLLSLSKSVLEEGACSSALGGLLFKDVPHQVLVPLEQSVGVYLSVAHLLLSVSLDPPQKCFKLVFLPFNQPCLFLGELLL